MDVDGHARRGIPAGSRAGHHHHLIPLVEFLMERGHLPIVNQQLYGFFYLAGRKRCWLGRRITPEVWKAINDRFDLPDNITYHPGFIHDTANGVLVLGWNRIILEDGVHPVEVWEDRGCPEVQAEPAPERTIRGALGQRPPQAEAPPDRLLRVPSWQGENDRRERIGRGAEGSHEHLVPLAEFLIERGHKPVSHPETCGFRQARWYAVCRLSGRITTEDWEAIGERFRTPFTITYFDGQIEDRLNRVYIMGADEQPKGRDKRQPPGVWDVENTERKVVSARARPPRERIPAGPDLGHRHLIPVAKFLIERGHVPIYEDSEFGFSGGNCTLARIITPADWEAINNRFVMPDSIAYLDGLIRDNANQVDMVGTDELRDGDGIVGIEIWEDEHYPGPEVRGTPSPDAGDARIVIPAGRQEHVWKHLVPIVELLTERGHPPLAYADRYGFRPGRFEVTCRLARRITADDWAAIDARFALPDTVVFRGGLIRDRVNDVSIRGYDEEV